MYCICIGNFYRRHDARHIEVAFCGSWWPDANCLVGKAYMQAVTVGCRINRHRFDAHFLAGSNDPEGNFPPIRDEYFFKHLYLKR